MSERKSWDVQPNRKVQPPAPAPVRATASRKVEIKKIPARTPAAQRAPRTQQPIGALKVRRKRERRVAQYVFLALLGIFIAGSVYTLWLPVFRVSEVSAGGPGSNRAPLLVKNQIAGTYAFILPRNSVFFLPEQKIRTVLLEAIPEASAVSLNRTSFSSLRIETTGRAESFIWCGTTIDTPVPDGSCYEADSDGFIFRRAEDISTASTTPQAPREQVRVFGVLDRELADGDLPIGARLVSPSRIPDALKFVDAVRELGAPVSALVIRGDEADLWLGRPARITYVLGYEKDAALLAASAFPAINLADTTIQYIDLRFPGKAYIKRYGE